MKKVVKNILLLCISLVIGFLLHKLVIGELLLIYFPSISMDISINLIAIILEGLFVFLVSYQMIDRKIDKISINLLWSFYFVFLIFVLFVRPIGFRALNLNPLEFIYNIRNNSSFLSTLMLNILIFVPFGFLFRNRKSLFSILTAISVFLIIECIQYIFKLGIFDIDDIIFNLIGFLIGYKILSRVLIKIFNKN